jgi:S1-C subfamily serine protease
MDSPRVDRPDGRRLSARVVSFDRTNDVAVLRVSEQLGRPLTLADAVDGTAGAMLGYPGNGPYTETPVRVGKTVGIISRDAYGAFPTSRLVTSVRGELRSGNSGGPIVNASGEVIATVFARRIGKSGGYGVPTPFVRAALSKVGTKTLATPCVDH